jgi:hypothetical protein
VEMQTIPTIINGVASHSVKNHSLKGSDASTDSINQCIVRLHDSIRDLNKTVHVSNNLRKIVLIGDSHIKGFVDLLQSKLTKEYNLFSSIKPGSKSNILKDTANEIVKQLSQEDLLVISRGTNDLDNSSKTFQNLRNYLVNLNHTNVLLLSIPSRFDLTNYDTMNSKITLLNKKLQKLTITLPYTRFLDSDNNRKLFTKHGLHRNKL